MAEKSYLHHCLDRAAKLAGVETLDPGTFRHSFDSWASMHGMEYYVNSAGVPLDIIAQVLGHDAGTEQEALPDGR